MCMKCSGIHRNLGTHISKVRSVELDRWNAAQVERLRDVGNTRSNEFWEHAVPETYRHMAVNAKAPPSLHSLRRPLFLSLPPAVANSCEHSWYWLHGYSSELYGYSMCCWVAG
jgi:hypothetical protein